MIFSLFANKFYPAPRALTRLGPSLNKVASIRESHYCRLGVCQIYRLPNKSTMSLDKDPSFSELYRTLISASHILHYHK